MSSTITPSKLRCAYATAPLGLEADEIRFSWQVQAHSRDALQSAWQLQVAAAGGRFDEARYWDSGKVESAEQLHIPYAGQDLEAHGRYQWRIKLWDGGDEASEWSEPASFALGVQDKAEWARAQWIRHFHGSLRAAPHLRKAFEIKSGVKDARLYATARGLVHLEINGRPVSDQCFLPGWTDYSLRLPSQCWDVTGLLDSGENVIGAQLGQGWYRGELTWNRHRGVWGGELELLAMLRLELEDGSVQWICTDESWQSAAGPILADSFLDGEQYDANLEMPGWSDPGFETPKRWYPVQAQQVGDVNIERHKGVPVRELHEFQPVDRWQPGPGRWIFDLGRTSPAMPASS